MKRIGLSLISILVFITSISSLSAENALDNSDAVKLYPKDTWMNPK